MWRRWGTPQNFSFGIYWWTLKNPKNQIFEKINNSNKNCWRHHHFTYLYQKPQSYEVQFLWYWVRQKHFLILEQFFASTHPALTTQKTKNWKNVKNSLRNYPFTHVQYKSRSHDTWFLRYKVQRTKFFVILGNLLPFDPCNNPKNQNLNNKKRLKIISFYKCVPKIKIIWCMIPEIWSAKDRIFSHFEPFFALFTHHPLNNSKNQNFEKLKKNPTDIIILHKCTIKDNHMIYGFWDINCNRQTFLSFWAIF